MRTRFTFILVSLLALGACSHDLDKLKTPSGGSSGQGASGNGAAGSGTSMAGTSGSAGHGGAGSSAGTGGGTAGTGDSTACEPCTAPPTLGAIKPSSCCTGSRSMECGEKFAAIDRCYPLDVPGNTGDPACLDYIHNGTTFPGCCRPDGACGVVVDALHLGCVVREEVPAAFGGPLKAHVCDPKCTTDADCMAFADDLICTQDSLGARNCARFCQRDKDCSDLPNKVCAIQNNTTDNRVDTLCRKPFGSGMPGDPCTDPSDCAHGTCLPASPPATGNACTELCGSDTDCTLSGASCVTGTILTPVAPKTKQTIRFCR